jgi:hypothetical protein
MNTTINTHTCQFYRWMGVEPSETTTQVESFNTIVSIGAVRNLFEKIIPLKAKDRKVVNTWGLHVHDQITIELIAWGVFKVNQHYQSRDLMATLTPDDFRRILFEPCLIGQHRIKAKELAKSHP